MMRPRAEIEALVAGIVAETLSVDPASVRAHSSLIDDLGAESIDFLDLLFRLETAFGIKIPEDELWRGAVDPAEMESADGRQRALSRLKSRMPDFRWDGFPADPKPADFARLITVRTIVDYLESRV